MWVLSALFCVSSGQHAAKLQKTQRTFSQAHPCARSLLNCNLHAGGKGVQVPFSAVLDGVRVLATLMDDAQWAAAKGVTKQDGQRLLVNMTQQPGFARTSPLGLRHFAHRRGYGSEIEWVETPEHLAIKSELVRAIHAQGWVVDTEVPSGPERNWVADVLAEKAGRRVAFEVQWSPQDIEGYVQRTARYAQEGIECIWLARKVPVPTKQEFGTQLVKDYLKIPIFELEEAKRLSESIRAKDPAYTDLMVSSMPAVQHGLTKEAHQVSLQELVVASLTGKLRAAEVFTVDMCLATCANCNQGGVCWKVGGGGYSQQVNLSEAPEENSLIQAGVAKARDLLGWRAPLGRISRRTGYWAAVSGYTAFRCARCGGGWLESQFDRWNYEIGLQDGNVWRFEVPVSDRWTEFLTAWSIPTHQSVRLMLSIG